MLPIHVGTGAGGPGTATLTLSLVIGGGLGVETPTLPALINSYSPGDHRLVDLAIGDNTFSLNGLSGILVLFPPTGCTATLKIKKVGGDQGDTFVGVYAKGLTNPPQSTVIINSSAVVSNFQIYNP